MRRFFLIALCMAAGCAEPLRDQLEIAITSQSGSTDKTVTFVVRNRGGTVAYVPRCGENVSTDVERLEGSSWINASAGICLANQRMDAIRLDPGAEFSGSRGFQGSGQFRLRTGVAASPAEQMDWRVVSDAFGVP